ncbi:phage terminase small subunit P27 family [Lacticaseibacillus pabuli]|uniref:Phage terminase small subunit P27 family n=1 Tax=Lacticaseibacillus pabuli TaxID=3025672 RepID=A0ABY7WPD4_9LACO|nr:phage terminase small subunit P27 family [Lacticaseibacillus sp. KACC 23028]WDF82063.1 phage terminase small subunit P27 family [Lacticaseibacillus sp. KACC 23028]
MGSHIIKSADELKGHMTKQEINARHIAEDALQNVDNFNATPPDWLDDKALAEWERVVPLLADTVPINNLDASQLAAYCQSVSDVATAQEHINRDGLTVPLASGEGEKPSPYVAIKRQALQEQMKLAEGLGLTVYGRLKMNINGAGVGVDDPLADLLA